jgi:hypothetical protein
MSLRTVFVPLLGVALLVVQPFIASAAEPVTPTPRLVPVRQLDFSKILTDIQRIRNDGTHLYMSMWAVPGFWLKAAELSGQDPESKDAQHLGQLARDYHILLVSKATLDVSGDSDYATEETLRANTRLLDSEGNSYAPISDKEMKREMRGMMAMLREFTRNSNGEQPHMHILLFPGKNEAGNYFADATVPGMLVATIDGQRLDYRLPLGSLLEPKRDPATGETFPGNFEYSPYTGTRLQAAPATK